MGREARFGEDVKRPPGADVVFGWDVGGAHLKFAVVEGGCLIEAGQLPCPLWLGVERLRDALQQVLDGLPGTDRHAVTMTGELADIFPDRARGVAAILEVLDEALPGADIVTYATGGGFLSVDEARSATDRVASANWDATSRLLAARFGNGLLVDIGSTTTDIVPFRDGCAAARGFTDFERLAAGELVYTGIVRTPLAAVAREVPFAGHRVPVMAEFFATMADAHRLMGMLPDGADQHPTADGRGKTTAESRARLARMIGMDAAAAPDAEWESLAASFVREQIRLIEKSAETVLSAAGLPREAPLIGAGTGRFLAAEIARRLGRPYASFESVAEAQSPRLASLAADVAPAVAVALLLADAER